MPPSAYQPFGPARRPGGKPAAKPAYRVLVHRKYLAAWGALPDRVGLASAQQFWDHVATTPGQPPRVNSSTILRGNAGRPNLPGFSHTFHYEISGPGRINYQYSDAFSDGARRDAHPVVFILSIALGSH